MTQRKSGHATGMAGEFFTMERLFRLGHEPALTLGNAKSIDIIVRTKSGNLTTVSVKSVRGGGKWPVGTENYSRRKDLVFVFLLYRHFDNPKEDPCVWVMPAPDVERQKRRWLVGSAVYYQHKELAAPKLAKFRDAWEHIG